jgi:hypothetical protein
MKRMHACATLLKRTACHFAWVPLPASLLLKFWGLVIDQLTL